MKLSELKKISQLAQMTNANQFPHHLQEIIQNMGMEPSSFYQELEMDSPYVDTHQDISYSNRNLQFHSHKFYEVICCRNTCNAEYLIGSERYKLIKGDIIFVPPGFSHCPLLQEEMSEPYIRDVLWISEKFMQMLSNTNKDLKLEGFLQPFLFRTSGTGWESLCEQFHEGVIESEAEQLGWSSIVAANTIDILIQLLRAEKNNPVKPLKAEKPELLDRVLAYVEEHLAEKISLADIARNFYVSESTVTQTFRKKMGISFYRCVTQRRLISAKKLIEDGTSLESTAELVGFSDYSSFFRAFKQEYGISPRQYRKIQSAKEGD